MGRGTTTTSNAIKFTADADQAIRTMKQLQTSAASSTREISKSSRSLQKNQNNSRRMNQILLEGSRGFEDFAVVLGTQGFSGAVRASSNNLSQMASLINPQAGVIAGTAAAITTLLLPSLTEWANKNDRVAKSLENLKKLQEEDLRKPGRLRDIRNLELDEFDQRLAKAKMDLKDNASAMLKANERIADANRKGGVDFAGKVTAINAGKIATGISDFMTGRDDSRHLDRAKTLELRKREDEKRLVELGKQRVEIEKRIKELNAEREGVAKRQAEKDKRELQGELRKDVQSIERSMKGVNDPQARARDKILENNAARIAKITKAYENSVISFQRKNELIAESEKQRTIELDGLAKKQISQQEKLSKAEFKEFDKNSRNLKDAQDQMRGILDPMGANRQRVLDDFAKRQMAIESGPLSPAQKGRFTIQNKEAAQRELQSLLSAAIPQGVKDAPGAGIGTKAEFDLQQRAKLGSQTQNPELKELKGIGEELEKILKEIRRKPKEIVIR